MAGEDGDLGVTEGAEVDPSLEAGTVESGAEGSGQEAPVRQYVEVDDPDNRYVRVKVNGEEIEVPFREAVEGYSRTADYTRKGQEAAALRQEAERGLAIQRALQANPAAALRLLQEEYLREAPAAPEVPQFDDPLEAKLWETQQQLAQMQQRLDQRAADEHLSGVIGSLKQQGASDEDIMAAAQYGQANGLPFDALPMIYRAQAFDRLVANFQAHQQTAAQRAAAEQQRQQAAQAAGGLIANGQSSTPGVSTAGPPNSGFKSIREAAEAALEQFGVPS